MLDGHADRAQRRMTVQMEHTRCEDPLREEAAVLSECEFILLFCLVSELYGCLSMQICTPHAIAVDMHIIIN